MAEILPPDVPSAPSAPSSAPPTYMLQLKSNTPEDYFTSVDATTNTMQQDKAKFQQRQETIRATSPVSKTINFKMGADYKDQQDALKAIGIKALNLERDSERSGGHYYLITFTTAKPWFYRFTDKTGGFYDNDASNVSEDHSVRFWSLKEPSIVKVEAWQ